MQVTLRISELEQGTFNVLKPSDAEQAFAVHGFIHWAARCTRSSYTVGVLLCLFDKSPEEHIYALRHLWEAERERSEAGMEHETAVTIDLGINNLTNGVGEISLTDLG